MNDNSEWIGMESSGERLAGLWEEAVNGWTEWWMDGWMDESGNASKG